MGHKTVAAVVRMVFEHKNDISFLAAVYNDELASTETSPTCKQFFNNYHLLTAPDGPPYMLSVGAGDGQRPHKMWPDHLACWGLFSIAEPRGPVSFRRLGDGCGAWCLFLGLTIGETKTMNFVY